MARPHSSRASRDAVGVIDIGTAKVCAAVALPDADGRQTLLGLGHQRSRGIKSGTIIDADEAEYAIRTAVGQAERMAGISFDRVIVSLSSGRMRSTSFIARAPVDNGIVTDRDIDRILSAGEAWLDRSGRASIQLTHSDWSLDGVAGITDPRKLAGRELAAELTAITADEGPVRNLLGLVEKCHMLVERIVAAPYASALAVTTEVERQQGVLTIEMGAGVTSIAAFCGDRLVHIDTVPVGGNHVTFDIARELVTSVPEAERIKTLYGSLLPVSSDISDLITYPVAGGDEPDARHETSKAHIREIVTPRIKGLFQLLTERITEAGLDHGIMRRIVLTGGASQLLGIDRLCSERFGGTVRIGRPQPVGGMNQSLCTPAFSTVLGLLDVAAQPPERSRRRDSRALPERGYLHRVERWIRESF
ncbi:MAG: cell division protein FtsA [Hyphomicrobiaceae bacterium]